MVICRVMDVSRKSYYKWIRKPDSVSTEKRELLKRQKDALTETFNRHNGTLGARRLAFMVSAKGIKIGYHKTRKLMKELGLVCRIRRKYRAKSSNAGSARVYENLLGAMECLESTNQAWVTDITYIRTKKGWNYFAAVMDAFSRRIIGYAYSTNMKAELAVDAVKNAVRNRGNVNGVVMHSDRGSQYTSDLYQSYIESLGMRGSMSAKGYCYDNAKMERFFGSLKDSCIVGQYLTNPDEVSRKLFGWVEIEYNAILPHSAISYLTPIQYEESFDVRQAA